MPSPLLSYVFVAAYLLFAVFWVRRFSQRVEPAMRERIGRMLGRRINRRGTGRSSGWYWAGEGPRRSGCLLLFWEFVVNFGCAAGPLFGALLIMGLLMFALYGNS